MSKLSRNRGRVISRRNRGIHLERLEGRALLASVVEFGGLTSGSTPTEITTGSNQNLFFTQPAVDQLTVISTGGGTGVYTASTGGQPEGVTSGPDGNIWYTDPGTNQIGEIVLSGLNQGANISYSPAITANAGLQDITSGPDDNLWFTEKNVDKIGKYNLTTNTVTEYSVAAGDAPDGITSGPDGELWATAHNGNKLIGITTAGAVSEYTIPSGGNPVGITTGTDGKLWFTESSSNKIASYDINTNTFASYSIPTTNSDPLYLTSGPNGDLFFTENNASKIGEITTTGNVIGEYPTPTSNSGPDGITIGPDNHVWFTESTANQIGRLNLPPSANNDSANGVENTPQNFNVLSNDTDPENDSLVPSVVASTTHGTLVLNSDETFTYTPIANYYGTDSFTYNDSDGYDTSNTATVTIHVDAPPVAVNDSYSAIESTTLTESAVNGVLANDTQPQGELLTASVVSNPTHFSVFSFNPSTGAFSYTPTSGYYGTDSFTYQDSDGYQFGNTATVTIHVDAPPVAVDDSYTAIENTALIISTANGVLANDGQAQGESLNAVIVTGPANGGVQLLTNGSFAYTPNANFFGIDTFTYQDNDGYQNGNTATVTIHVDAPPVAVNDSYSAIESTTLTESAVNGVLANDTQPQGELLTASVVSNPTHFSVFSFNPSTGAFSYTPTSGYYGTTSFTYQDSDGYQFGNTATVTIHVDAPPVAVDDSYMAIENTALIISTANGVLANDGQAQGESLNAVIVTGPANGGVQLLTNGSFAYTPNANFFGIDTFTYQDNDGYQNGNTATVTIHVDAPPVAVNDAYSTRENAALNVNAASGVQANDTDSQSNPFTSVLVTGPTSGSLTLNPYGSFAYIPNPEFFGTDSFTYKDNDGLNDGNTATVIITVAQDHAPVAVDDSQAVGEGGYTATAPGILANDTDADSDPITALLVSGTSDGYLDFHSDGSYLYIPNPSFGAAGSDSFTYRAFDGLMTSNVATVTLTFDGTYDPPVALPQSFTVAEGSALTSSGLLTGATDYWNLPLSASIVSQPAHGSLNFDTGTGSFTYTPAPGFHGVDGFTYEATNGHSSSAAEAVTLNVTQVFGPPLASVESYTVNEGSVLGATSQIGVLANAVSPNGSPLSAILVTNPTHGTLALNGDGSFFYTPSPLYSGQDSFTYLVNNGQINSNVATVNLTVTHVNHPPVAVNDSYTTLEGTSVITTALTGVLANDTDLDGDPLTASVVTKPSHGSLTFNPDGSFTYIPSDLFSGPDTFTYIVSDGQSTSNTATVTLTMTHVNHAPIALNDSYTTTAGASPLNVPSNLGLLANDTDLDLDAITAVLVANPTHGLLSFNSDGSFTYTPVIGFSGLDSFTYRDYDGQTLGNTATVSVTVNPAPVPAPKAEVPGDYDGDGKADVAVYLPALGAFEIKDSSDGATQIFPFGMAGQGASIPAPGDYDGSGKTELAVYLPSIGAFAYRPADGGPDQIIPFGMAGTGNSIPAPGDYDGSGHTELAVYLPSIGAFAYRPADGGPDQIIPFGMAGQGASIPAPGDYDGSGKTELAVYLPSIGAFAYRPADGGPDKIIPFGMAGTGGSIPMPGDYDGSGHTELAVYLPSVGDFAYRPADGGPDVIESFGLAGSGQTLVASGDYTGTGHDELAAYLPSYGSFAIRVGGGQSDIVQSIGLPGNGQTIPVTVVDQALAEITPTTVSAASITIPDSLVTTTSKKHKTQ